MFKPSRNILILSTIIGVLLLLNISNAWAQNTGKITGTVIDAKTKEVLPAANIFLEDTGIGRSSDQNGQFTLAKVPAESYTLNASYIGYNKYSKEVVVEANQTTTVTIEMNNSSIQGEGVVVTGFLKGEQKALMKQRNAPNVQNIVAREQMDQFPDNNTAEVLQRLPGVAVERSGGDANFVLLRGTRPRLTNVTINGNTSATPDDEGRAVQLDIISSDQLETVEVSKVLTPDMSANAIGGTVNLVTKTAFDYQKRQNVQLNIGSGYNFLSEDPQLKLSGGYSRKLGKKENIGISINGNWMRQKRLYYDNEMDWDNEDNINGNEIPFALKEIKLRNYAQSKDRIGFNTSIEFRPNPNSTNNRYFVKGMYNRRNQDRRLDEFTIGPGEGDYIDATHTQGSEIARALDDESEQKTILSFQAGGENTLGDLSVDYSFYYSFGKTEKPGPDGEIEPEFTMGGLNMSLDESNVDAPQYTITNKPSGFQYDPVNYQLKEVDYRIEHATNKLYLGNLKFEYPYALGGSRSKLKFGGKTNSETKDRGSHRSTWDYVGDSKPWSQFSTTGFVENDWYYGDYHWGPSTDPDKIRAFFFQNTDNENIFEQNIKYDDDSGLGAQYDVNEDVYAYYFMTTNDFGRLSITAGFRQEFTSTDYAGNVLNYDDNGDFQGLKSAKGTESYNNFFPMALLRYNLNNSSILRLSATRTISRPDYYDLVPYQWIFPEDGEVAMGNPELDPTKSTNLDFKFSHYFQNIGIISAAVFYKSLNEIIYKSTYKGSGNFDGYDIEQPVNGGTANLYGFEINWQQQLRFLPGFLNGFGIYANYTLTHSNADLKFRNENFLPGQADQTGNLALSYTKYGFSGRLSANYNDTFVEEVGKSAGFDEYRNRRFQLDFSANYTINSHISIYTQAQNLTNAYQLDYMGTRERPIQRESYSVMLLGGLKYSL